MGTLQFEEHTTVYLEHCIVTSTNKYVAEFMLSLCATDLTQT
jgi:hypothetical protein